MTLHAKLHYWRKQFKILLHNLFLSGDERKVRVTCRRMIGRDDLFHITAGNDEFYIVAIGRWKFYRYGLQARFDKLASQYGALDYGEKMNGRVVIDIGSNMGEFSRFCDGHGASVYAIEPDPVNFAALEKNLEGSKVKATRLALWHEEDDVTFYSSVAGADSSFIRPTVVDRSYDVKAVPLDKFTNDHNIDEVFFIKGDAEGAEPEVMRGAAETLKRTHYISMDCGPERQGETTVDECTSILQELGFETRVLGNRGGLLFGTNKRFL